MAAGVDPASSTPDPRGGCRHALLSNLNPFTLYDPRYGCSQGTFLWGIVYPLVPAFCVYFAVMVAGLVIAASGDREPSELINQAAFASAVSIILMWVRLILGVLIVVRRAKDLAWNWVVALVWLVLASLSVQSAVPIPGWIVGGAQFLLLLVLLVLPGKIARSRKVQGA